MSLELFEKAEKAINDLYGDTSVTQEQTKEDLEVLQADIQDKINALNETIALDSDDEEEEG